MSAAKAGIKRGWLLLRSEVEQAARQRMRAGDLKEFRQLQHTRSALVSETEKLTKNLEEMAQEHEKQTEKQAAARAQEREKAAMLRADVSLYKLDAKAR